jgi:hypothetical protein
VVESTALEMRRTCKGIGGSNPSLSAIFIMAGLLSFASPASGQNQKPSAPIPNATLDPATGKLLDAFGGLAAAWYIEKRCDHLGKDLKAEFERNVAQTNVGLSRKVEVKFNPDRRSPRPKVAATKRASSSSKPSP